MGQLRKGSFDIGGKQLTPFEDSVVRMTIPTTKDSPEAYKAKLAWLGSYVSAQQYYVSWSRLNPRLSQDATAQQQAWEMAKRQAGIDTTKATDWMRNQSPDDRVRSKMGK